jgi:hypothetical protein
MASFPLTMMDARGKGEQPSPQTRVAKSHHTLKAKYVLSGPSLRWQSCSIALEQEEIDISQVISSPLLKDPSSATKAAEIYGSKEASKQSPANTTVTAILERFAALHELLQEVGFAQAAKRE